MSDDFDHYYKWLGIPPTDQPPNHYRLLGSPNFTDDPEVIANATDQRAAHLRTFQPGPRSALSQRILNEVARARVCLLAPDMKAAYDAQLGASIAVPLDSQSATPTDIAATPTLAATRTGAEVFFGQATDQLKTVSPKKTPDPLPLNVQKPTNTAKHLPREQRTSGVRWLSENRTRRASVANVAMVVVVSVVEVSVRTE